MKYITSTKDDEFVLKKSEELAELHARAMQQLDFLKKQATNISQGLDKEKQALWMDIQTHLKGKGLIEQKHMDQENYCFHFEDDQLMLHPVDKADGIRDLLAQLLNR